MLEVEDVSNFARLRHAKIAERYVAMGNTGLKKATVGSTNARPELFSRGVL